MREGNNKMLQVMQISCNAPWKPAEGCLQYFTGEDILDIFLISCLYFFI